MPAAVEFANDEVAFILTESGVDAGCFESFFPE